MKPFAFRRALELATCVVPLAGISFHLGHRLSRPSPIPPPPVPVIKEKPKPELPRLVAVDGRIARRVNALRPCVKQRLVRVVEKLPRRVTLLVTSATRTREEQAALRSTFGVKAPPGKSTHEDGRAVDLNVFVDGVRVPPRRQNQVIGAAMASEGFRHLGRIDPVHYSLPVEELDPDPIRGPLLDVMTMDEMVELKAGTLE